MSEDDIDMVIFEQNMEADDRERLSSALDAEREAHAETKARMEKAEAVCLHSGSLLDELARLRGFAGWCLRFPGSESEDIEKNAQRALANLALPSEDFEKEKKP